MKTYILICLIFIINLNLSGQEKQFQITIDHIALSVKDVDKATDFYMEILSLDEITNRTEMDGIRWLSLGKNKELHLISLLDEPIKTNKAIHFAITVTHFETFLDNLRSNNIPFSDWPGTKQKVNIRADGVQQVFFQDLDGHWIEANSKNQ